MRQPHSTCYNSKAEALWLPDLLYFISNYVSIDVNSIMYISKRQLPIFEA